MFSGRGKQYICGKGILFSGFDQRNIQEWAGVKAGVSLVANRKCWILHKFLPRQALDKKGTIKPYWTKTIYCFPTKNIPRKQKKQARNRLTLYIKKKIDQRYRTSLKDWARTGANCYNKPRLRKFIFPSHPSKKSGSCPRKLWKDGKVLP